MPATKHFCLSCAHSWTSDEAYEESCPVCNEQDLESSPADPLLESIEKHNESVSDGDTSFPFGANS